MYANAGFIFFLWLALPQELGWVLLIPELCLPSGAFAAVMMIYCVITHCCQRPFVSWRRFLLVNSMFHEDTKRTVWGVQPIWEKEHYFSMFFLGGVNGWINLPICSSNFLGVDPHRNKPRSGLSGHVRIVWGTEITHDPKVPRRESKISLTVGTPQGRCALRIGDVHLAVQQRLVDD